VTSTITAAITIAAAIIIAAAVAVAAAITITIAVAVTDKSDQNIYNFSLKLKFCQIALQQIFRVDSDYSKPRLVVRQR
jgi:hypothetical protein